MKKLRLGIIGVGKMGRFHLKNIVSGACPSWEVTAYSGRDPVKRELCKELCPNAKGFQTAEDLIDSGLVDAVLISVLHYAHPEIAIKAFEKGLHVMIEKPAGVFTSQVMEMNDAAKRSGKKFGIMFNQRTKPIYKRAREIVQSGELGELKRIVWIVTDWYRTQHYYDSADWRATWNGDGGGILLNQAPHNIDLMTWICGMPKRIRAFCTFGKYHNIDVDDDVTIYGEYDNGATATFITTTGDACGTNRLEINGDRGKLVIEDGKLKWWKLKTSERELCFTSQEDTVRPETEYQEYAADSIDGRIVILNDFADAILEGAPLIAPGEEGLNSLNISNAAYLSTWTDDWVDIPVDGELFEKYLAERCKKEKAENDSVVVSEAAEELCKKWKL